MAGYPLKKDTATLPLVFTMYDSTQSRPVGKTGLTPTVVISKNGAAFGSPAGAIEEIGNGKYKVVGHVDDTNTLGPLELYATAAGADPTWETYFVVNYNPLDADSLGLTRLDAAVGTRLATAGYIAPDNASAAAAAASSASVDGKLTSTRAGYLDAAISSRLQSSFGTTINQIHNSTQLLPPALGILGYVGFFAREEVGAPTADQLVAEDFSGLPYAVGHYIVLTQNISNPPGVPSGLIWQITAIDGLTNTITMTPVGHTTSVQAWLGSESVACQGVTLAANSPLLGAVRVNTALPNAAPNGLNGLPLRNFFTTIQSAADAFVGLISGGRYTAFALSLAPSGGGGGGGALADADIDWSFSARPTTGGAFILQALSVEYLKAVAAAFVGERQIDPTAYTVEFAFVTSSSALGAATWHECEWDENGLARLLMGPGEVALTAGAYYWYVRVTSSPETSLQRLDPILRVE